MASIPQRELFAWQDVNELGDLARLELVLGAIPDESLMEILERERGHGRDDYPIRPVWNSILAGVVFQHDSVESLARELRRNAQLREVCGFSVTAAAAAVPSSNAYSRFLSSLLKHPDAIECMFDDLVELLRQVLPDFGRDLGVDGKALPTHARKKKDSDGDEKNAKDDARAGRRRETDANVGVKTYGGKRKDGSLWKTVKSWFGFKLHLCVDTNYELPVAYDVTRASEAEINVAKQLLKQTNERHPEIIEECRALTADKGYDDTALITALWDDYGIKPVIDIRNCWQAEKEEKDEEAKTRVVPGQTNVVYDYRGNVYCHCPKSGTRRDMAYGGFEEDRGTLKYRCPAKQYGTECAGAAHCPAAKSIRIKIAEERRIFTPMARSSLAWERSYKARSAVERVNSRIDVSYGFERHFIRGLAKMKVRAGLALVVMLAMALGRIRHNQPDKLRSLVAAAG